PLASAHSPVSTNLQKSRFPEPLLLVALARVPKCVEECHPGGNTARRWQLKEKGSYGKAVSSQCLRAHQQRHDLVFIAPGRTRMEFLTAHGARTEKRQAHRDPTRDFCPGSETLPAHPVRGRELGAQPPRGWRRGHPYAEPT